MAKKMPLGRAMLLAVNYELADRASDGHALTPAAISKATGIPDKTLRRRLSGEVALDADDFEAIADALGMTTDALWARARRIQDDAERPAETLSEHIIGQLSPEAQVQVREAKAAVTKRAAENGPTG